MPNDFNQPVIDEFRANRGRVGGPFEGGRLILLTSTGARTGKPHTNPLGYLPDDERILVIGSAGGGPHHPDWYHNILANPRVTVETGLFTYEANAVVLQGEEREEAFARAVEYDPGWGAYQARTTRVLPVVALVNASVGPPTGGQSMGQALVLIHEAMRREFATIRRELARSGASLGVQLKINCATACNGLRHHHLGEDGGIFPALARQHPDLAPVLERLHAEHERVANLVTALEAALHKDSAAVGAEVDRLIAELEAHLAYEEEHLVPILDGAR
jgi:deazaflavin-dependent oxidoreductase (nitroreductase family)